MAREVIKKGTDVRSIRQPINDAFAALPTNIRTEGAASTTSGNTMSFSVVGTDLIYIRLDSKTGTSPIKYAWTMMVQDRDTGAWTASPRAGLTTDDSFAVELNNASLTTGTSKRYQARVNPHTGRVTFDQGGTGGGIAEIKSGDTRLMILGTYDDYKDCPGVPAKPPTLKTACGTDTGDLCVPAYAYAVYQRCGYIWQKVGDTRDFGVWANETNGGSTSAFRRFHVPCWGGDRDPTTWLPDPESACMGVTFEPTSAGALTCSCPPCIDDIECLVMRFRTIPRPCEYDAENIDCGLGCTNTFNTFDAFDLWDKEYEIELTLSGCNWSGLSDDLFFATAGGIYDGSISGCDWGPDVFDPCDPCAHWSTIRATFSIPGGNGPNCGSDGHWIAGFNAKAICNLLCGGDPVAPTELEFCGNCIPFIVADSIEIDLCPGDMIMGGTPGALPTDFIDGGTPGALPTDFIDGNY